jgi:hypothetical protein
MESNVVNFLRLIAEWVAVHFGYIVLISFLSSLGSLAFALIQVQKKKQAVSVSAPIVAEPQPIVAEPQFQPDVFSLLRPMQGFGVSGQGRGLGLSVVAALAAAGSSPLVIHQQIRGQGLAQESGPESALIEAGRSKGFYGTSSYSPS